MGSEPFSAAAISAVEPSACNAFASAPCCNRSATAGPLPEPAAMRRGVKPPFEKALRSALAARSACAVCLNGWWSAGWRMLRMDAPCSSVGYARRSLRAGGGSVGT